MTESACKEGNTDAARLEEREVNTNRGSGYAPLEEERGTSWVSVASDLRPAWPQGAGVMSPAPQS